MHGTTTATIDLGALRANVEYVRELVGPSRLILACVKANAYGHGAVACGKRALESGADALGIARLDEALELRDAGIRGRIILLGPESLDKTEELVRSGIEIAIDGPERLEAAIWAGRKLDLRPVVHLAINSGMGRFGASFDEAERLVLRLAEETAVRWAGVMTHFPTADSDRQGTIEEWRRFETLLDAWDKRGLRVPCRHVANSAAIMAIPETHSDMVRPGIMLYGIPPGKGQQSNRLLPVLRLESTVVALHWRQAGEHIGYGSTFLCNRRTLVATIPAGYADGIPWSAANRAWVLINGTKAPVIGRISMDQTTIDVTDVPSVTIGTAVVLIGNHHGEAVSADDWAGWCGTISYEITTRLRGRCYRPNYVG